MTWIGNQVVLYKECELRVPDGNGGYTFQKFREDELHRPLILTSAVNPHLNTSASNLIGFYNNPQPRKGRLLSELEVEIEYEIFTGLTGKGPAPKFLMLTGGSQTQVMEIYGWIDRAEPIATKGPKTNTLIHWHVDYWFTLQMMEWNANQFPAQWSTKAFAFGRGTFKRGPAGMARPDPSAPRTWKFSQKTNIVRKVNNINDQDGPYTIVLFTSSVAGPNNTSYTRLHVAFWGLQQTQITPTADKIPVQRVYDGLLEEMMNLAPSSIVGVWFSPVPPCDYSSATIQTHTFDNRLYGWYQYDAGSVPPTTYHYTFVNPIATTDTEKYLVVDPLGTVYGTLPWGLEADRMVLSVDVGSAGAWLNVDFKNGAVTDEWGEGRKMQLPLISAPVTSNDRSDYILSGQEEYDRTMARIQQEQNLMSGIAGIGGSAIGGAVAGTVAAPGVGTIAGAVSGLASGTIGAAANYWIQGETDRKSRNALDTLLSNQISNVIISGGGSNWYWTYAGKWYLVKMVRDPLSKGELETEQAERGYVCDTFTTNCTPTIQSSGPMRIEGLEVVGDLSKEARTYIQQMFARGVHLDLIY